MENHTQTECETENSLADSFDWYLDALDIPLTTPLKPFYTLCECVGVGDCAARWLST